MTTKVIRKMIKIDEAKCNGCGVCIPACAEGALQIVDGKAKLVDEKYCDGLGACLGECPQGALGVEDREAEEFDMVAVEHYLEAQESAASTTGELPCGCHSATVTEFEKQAATGVVQREATYEPSMLGHWPVQLRLVPPAAPFLEGADLVLAADCAPFAYAGFHQDFLKGHALLVACPKLDDFQAHQMKLNEILHQSAVKSLTVVRMEVPCCSGLVHLAKQAISASGKDIPLTEVVIGIRGEVNS